MPTPQQRKCWLASFSNADDAREYLKLKTTPPDDAARDKEIVSIAKIMRQEIEVCLNNAHWEVKHGSGDLLKSMIKFDAAIEKERG